MQSNTATTTKISTLSMSYDEWKAARLKGIGGSDVAAILGLTLQYKTPLDVFLEKTGQKPGPEENARMKAGKMLEDIIATWWAEENGYKIQKDNKIRIHRSHPELIANIDRMIIGTSNGPGILECKNTNSYAFKQWEDDGLPYNFYSQVQHYINVFGYDYGHVAVLIDGWDLRSIPVPRDQEYIDMMTFQLLDFWHNHVLKNIPPEPATEADFKTLWPSIKDNEKVVDVEGNEEIVGQVSQLLDIKTQLKTLEEEKKNLELQLKKMMKDSTILQSDGRTLITWRQGKDRTVFDKKKLEEAHPDIFSQCCDTAPGNRMFLLKK